MVESQMPETGKGSGGIRREQTMIVVDLSEESRSGLMRSQGSEGRLVTGSYRGKNGRGCEINLLGSDLEPEHSSRWVFSSMLLT